MATFTERMKQKGAVTGSLSFYQRYKTKQLSSQVKASARGDKQEATLEQQMHPESAPKPQPTFSGIDDVAQAKVEKFGNKQVGSNPFAIPKLDPSVDKFMGDMQAKNSGVNPVKIGSIEAKKAARQQTPIDQRLHFGGDALKNDSRSYIGTNILPAYKEDDPLTKLGKGIVNYGAGGALSLVSNISGAPQQAMMQADRAVVNAATGKKQDISEMSFGKDILGAKEDNFATMVIGTALDPATYIGGGIVDDLSKAGIMGKASRPSTEMVRVLGESQQKLLAKMMAKLPLTQVEIEVVNNTPELKALPEAKQYLMLPEGRVTTPDVIEALPIKPTLDDLDTLKRKPIDAPVNKNYPNLEAMDETYLKALSKELTTNKENLINEQIKWLKETSGNGVEQGKLSRDKLGNVVGRQGRISKNDKWYQEWAKKNSYRKPRNSDLREIAEKQLKEGYNTSDGFVPPNEDFNFNDEFIKNVDIEFNSPTRQNNALNKSKQYIEAKNNLTHTVPEQFRKETPFTVSRSTVPPKVEPKYAKESFDPLGGKLPKAGTMTANLGGKADLPKVKPVPLGGELPKVDTPQGRIYSDIPKGDIPAGQKERGFSRNIRTDEAMPDDIRTNFDETPLTYTQKGNDETLAKAQAIFEQGDEAATAELYRSLGSKEFKPETVPLSKLIAKQAIENGNVEKARQVLSETAEKLTEAGQFSQAAKILRESDPETFLMTIDKQLKKLNQQGAKQYGKKWTDVILNPDELEAIKSIPRGNQQAYEEAWEQIGSRIAKGLPSTGMEKFDAWRRIAMLLNPKTHIRNTVGNVIMSGMRKTSDTLGAAFEKAFVPAGQRTKSFGWSLNKNVASKVDEAWEVVKKDMLGESRWEIDNLRALGREKNTFKTKWLQGLNDASLKSLNWEDNIFTKRAYKDALGQFMQANKLDTATDKAMEYAKRRALEATFKQANMLSDFINKAKNIKGVGKLVEGAIPFSKTPANIAARAVEYSPIGLTKLLFSKGKTSAEVIETLSKGMTGSAVTALGVWLASMGWIKVERSRSDKAEGITQESGDQPNSIITELGSYTFDWAQPFAVPLAMGVAAYEAMSKREDGDSLIEAALDGIAAGGDTIFNMTMMQNIKQILGSSGSVSQKIMGIPVSYLEQAIPSIFGQAARTVDDAKRSTYDPNPLKQEWNRVKSRVPGLSQTLEPSLDIWGKEQSQGGWIQQFINPGYAKEKTDDAVTKEVARLYSSNKDNDMLPKVAPKSFSADKIEFRLTPKQLTEFQRRMGQENHTEIGRLTNSLEYRSMTDEQRIKKIKKIVNDNYEDIKKDIAKSGTLPKQK